MSSSISVFGLGGIGIADVSPSYLTFPLRSVGTTSVAQNIYLNNQGGASFNVSSIALTGANANEFTVTNNCGSSVVALTTCEIYVSFAPQTPGSKTASVVINGDSSAGLPLSVGLMGSAQ
jgi:hypothetical protein